MPITPVSSYVITTWEEVCPCGNIHRVYFVSDSDASAENGLNLHRLMKDEWPLQTTPQQYVISRDLLDGFFHKEMKP